MLRGRSGVKRHSASAGACFVGLLTALVLVSCASGATPKRAAYVTIDDATTAVQAGMTAFNEVYQAKVIVPPLGRPLNNDDRDKALAIYAKYQKAAELATLILKGTVAGDPTTAIGDVSAAAVDAIAALAKLRGK